MQLEQQQNWFSYFQVLILLAVATLVGTLLRPFVVPTNLVMLYLLVVVIAAVRWGYGPAVLSSALSVVCFNFFFVPREYTLQVADAQYLLTFAGLFVVGIVIADLTNRVRQQAAAAQRREVQTAELYALSRDIVATINLDTIVQAVLRHVSGTFQAEAAIFLYENQDLKLRAATPFFHLTADDEQITRWVIDNAQPAGCGTAHWSNQHTICLPLMTVHEGIGVLALSVEPQIANRPDFRHLIDAFANQAALAIEAARLAEEAQQAHLLREREKLQTALLNSISHDLRTPLVSISGTLSTLRDESIHYSEQAKRDLLDGAWQEARRLNRIVTNLLDMTRLQAGMIRLKRDWYDVQELIAVARSQLSERLAQRPLEIDVPSDLPLIEMDLTLLGQVIVNLLDNALKYSEPGTPLQIQASVADNQLVIEVGDYGSGIPEEDLPHIFEIFYRAHRTGGIGGTGLGLSICDGIVTAHHGTIEAMNRQGGGTVFRIRLPIHAPQIMASQETIEHESQNENLDY